MKLWTALNATTEPHTVETARGLVAGSLVRSLGGRKTYGYIWRDGLCWHWRTEDGSAYGDRATEHGAIEVLHDIDLIVRGAPAQAPLPWIPKVEPAPHRERPAVSAVSRVEPPKPPAPEPEHIVWSDVEHDLTAAVDAALGQIRVKGGA